jgi:hypothetical protein
MFPLLPSAAYVLAATHPIHFAPTTLVISAISCTLILKFLHLLTFILLSDFQSPFPSSVLWAVANSITPTSWRHLVSSMSVVSTVTSHRIQVANVTIFNYIGINVTCPENEDGMFLRTVGNYLQVYTALQQWRTASYSLTREYQI